MSIHEHHRKRLKDRFLKEGLENFDDLYVMEMLLFYCVPRKDTNELAHKIINRFGSVSSALQATPEELERIEGVGPGISTFFSFLSQLGRYCAIHDAKRETVLDNTKACREYLLPFFQNRRNETVFLLCLDAKCKVLECREVCQGTLNRANISVRRIVEIALAANATSVILAHNHPGGVAMPSTEDILTTEIIENALKTVDVYLADHIVCADTMAVSLVEMGCYKPTR